MKANTAAIKYCLTNAFLISWGDDPEADTTTDKPARKPRPEKETVRTKKAPSKDSLAEAMTVRAIQQATSLEQLSSMRLGVQLLEADNPGLYKELRAAFMARKEELTA